MKKYGYLFEKVTTFENLYAAARKAFHGKRANSTVARFYFNLENEIIQLREELLDKSYQPRPYGTFEIREPKVRQICSSHFRDRVVHHAICNILDPIVDKQLIFDTYACRTGKGNHAAIKRVRYFVTKANYFLKCDIRKYFPSIDHVILKQQLRNIIKDQRLLALLGTIVDHQVPGNPFGRGASHRKSNKPYFANLYLSPLDHFLKRTTKVALPALYG